MIKKITKHDLGVLCEALQNDLDIMLSSCLDNIVNDNKVDEIVMNASHVTIGCINALLNRKDNTDNWIENCTNETLTSIRINKKEKTNA
jgi:broad specificity phosphatase PhoE